MNICSWGNNAGDEFDKWLATKGHAHFTTKNTEGYNPYQLLQLNTILDGLLAGDYSDIETVERAAAKLEREYSRYLDRNGIVWLEGSIK